MNEAGVIGIDLGTINSCVAVWVNGKIEIIPNDIGERTTPSYVSFSDKEILVGETAKNQKNRNPNNTIFGAKRFIGRKFEEYQIQQYLKNLPFTIVKDDKSDKPQFKITYENKEEKYFPENILAIILKKLKKNASDFLGKEAKDAIISVPTYYTIDQLEEIREAANIAELNVLEIINSSTAAGMAYIYDKNFEGEKNIIIFDLGADSLNISLCSLEEGIVEVKSLDGIKDLGGEDFNNRLFKYCVDEFRRKTGIDIISKKNAKAISRLLSSCEEAKKSLSFSNQAAIDLEYLIGEEDLNIIITRKKFEDLCMDLFQRFSYPLENVLKYANKSKTQINEIILVGGSTRIPKIQEMIKEFFNGKDIYKGLNPDEAIAYGAAIQAAIKMKIKDEKIENILLINAIPFSLGIETVGGVMTVIIPRNIYNL